MDDLFKLFNAAGIVRFTATVQRKKEKGQTAIKGYALVMGSWFRCLMFSSSHDFWLSSSFSWASSSEICAFKAFTCSTTSWVWLPEFSPLDTRKITDKKVQVEYTNHIFVMFCLFFEKHPYHLKVQKKNSTSPFLKCEY